MEPDECPESKEVDGGDHDDAAVKTRHHEGRRREVKVHTNVVVSESVLV